MDYAWLIVPLASLVICHYAVVSRYQGLLTLDGIFVLVQFIMSAGSLVLLDARIAPDRLYALIMTLPLALYVATSTLTYLVLRGSAKHIYSGLERTIRAYRPGIVGMSLLILSAVITLLYFQAVGYNVFWLGLQSLTSGVRENYTELRIAAYGEGRYLFPGYVNQFKNIILPSLSFLAVLHLYRQRTGGRFLASAALIVLSIFALLGTGQRGAFIVFALVLVVFLYHFDRRRFPRRAGSIALVSAPFLLVSTLILGRSSTRLHPDAGVIETVSILGQEMLKRVFYDNQWSGQRGFWYTFDRPIQNGAEWVHGILGILPGNPGSPLAREIFANIYGADRGTAPPSLWGSVYYNFGLPGILVIPIGLGLVYQTFTFKTVNRPVLNPLELMGLSGLFVVAGTWIAGGPEYMLNSGAVTFGVLWLAGRRYGDNMSAVTMPQTAVVPVRTPPGRERRPYPAARNSNGRDST